MMYMLYVRILKSLLSVGASGTSPRAVLNDDVGRLNLDVPHRLRTAIPRRRTRNKSIFSTLLIVTRMRLLLRKFALGYYWTLRTCRVRVRLWHPPLRFPSRYDGRICAWLRRTSRNDRDLRLSDKPRRWRSKGSRDHCLREDTRLNYLRLRKLHG